MAPPPWDVTYSKAFMGDILRVTSKANDMTGFKWAPTKEKQMSSLDENHTHKTY
jgi:hypothetical protein